MFHALTMGIAGSSLLFSIGAGAVELDLSLDISEIYSNNITLQPDETAQSDFVTRIAPSIKIDYLASVAELRAEYTYEWLKYIKEPEFDQDYHQLNANGGVDLIGKNLRLMAEAMYSQVNVDPRRAEQGSNITVGGNRSNAFFRQIGPVWDQEILGSDLDAFYKYGKITFEDPTSQDVDSQRMGISSSSPATSASSTTYEVAWNYWILDYETSGTFRDQSLVMILRQEVASSIQLLGLIGMDSDLADRTESSLSELRWEAGFDYTRPDRHVSATIGERYFGTILRFSADKQLANWNYSVSYSEEPGTSASFRVAEAPISDDEEVPPPNSGLDDPRTSERFIRKRAEGRISWAGYASNWYWQVWWEQRDNLVNPSQGDVPIDGILAQDSKSVGTSIDYEWKIGARTTTGFITSWNYREFIDQDISSGTPTEIKSDIKTFSIGAHIRYELGVKTVLASSINYRDTSGTSSFNNFDEFRVSINLTRTF